MAEVLKAASMYALTGIVSAVASRYHLDGSQTAALTADAGVLIAGAAGVFMHWKAYNAPPPTK